MFHNRLISVIIPTYNREDVIGRAIESALWQTYKNIEIIIVDDGSTDSTLKRLEKFKNEFITIISQKNCGPSNARNTGASIAKGDYLAFLDSDDIWFPDKLEKQINLIEKAGLQAVCCLCNSIIRYRSKKETSAFSLAPLEVSYNYGLWYNVTEVLSTRSVVFTQAALIQKSAFQNVGGFDENLFLMEDWDLSLKLSLMGKWVYIKEPLLVYNRDREDSLSYFASKNRDELNKSILRICNNALSKKTNIPKAAKKEIQKKIRNSQRRLFISDQKLFFSFSKAYFSFVLFIDAIKIIIYRRLYKKIGGLLPMVQDKPI